MPALSPISGSYFGWPNLRNLWILRARWRFRDDFRRFFDQRYIDPSLLCNWNEPEKLLSLPEIRQDRWRCAFKTISNSFP